MCTGCAIDLIKSQLHYLIMIASYCIELLTYVTEYEGMMLVINVRDSYIVELGKKRWCEMSGALNHTWSTIIIKEIGSA